MNKVVLIILFIIIFYLQLANAYEKDDIEVKKRVLELKKK